ncbi:hypothetical protein QBC44DRAFT_390115, partial [Cladorrhinum sp. PSN332]
EQQQQEFNRSEWCRVVDDASTLQLEKSKLEQFEAKWHHIFQGQAMADVGHLIDQNSENRNQSLLESLLRHVLNGLEQHEALEGKPPSPVPVDTDETISNSSSGSERDSLSLKGELFQKALGVSNHAVIDALFTVLVPEELRAITKQWLPEGGTALDLAIRAQSPFTNQIIRLFPHYHSIFKQQDEDGCTPLHIAVASHVTDSTPNGYCPHDVVRHLIQYRDTALLVTDETGKTPYQLRHSQTRVGDDGVDETLEYMRIYILRTFEPEDALRALYPLGQERTIELNLEGIESQTLETYLDFMAGQFVWESVLRELFLPSLAPKADPIEKVKGKEHSVNARAGTYPLIPRVFQWLRRVGVRKIIRLVVQDDGLGRDYQESIVDALDGFQVEIWDWTRLDIPSHVLANSSSALRTVQLYYSGGGGAVLRDWTSSQGFQNQILFPELERVTVICSSATNIDQTREKILQAFETNKPSQRWGPDLALMIEINEDAAVSRKSKKEGIMTRHSGWPQLAASFWDKLIKTFPIQSSAKFQRVKVAILGHGVSPLFELATDTRPEWVGRSFQGLRPDTGASGISPWYISSFGHGTQVANVIATLCPCIKFYIAKIDTLNSPTERGSSQHQGSIDLPPLINVSFGSQRRNADIELVKSNKMQALKWALAAKVDLICLAFSSATLIQDNDRHGADEVEALNREARRQGIVILRDGEYRLVASRLGSGKYFPRSPSCMTIGLRSNKDRSDEEVDFMFPGDMRQDGPVREAKSGPISDISIATAQACGMGALLIHLQRLIQKDSGDGRYWLLSAAFDALVDIWTSDEGVDGLTRVRMVDMQQFFMRFEGDRAVDGEFIANIHRFFGGR